MQRAYCQVDTFQSKDAARARAYVTTGICLIIIFVLQPLSHHFHSFIDWDIINPATNHLGWYKASIQYWAVHWIWPSAWLVVTVSSGDKIRSWLLLVLLMLVNHGFPETSLWEIGTYTEEERWLIGLCNWYSVIARDGVASGLAIAASRWPALLIPAILISGLWIFT